jgi:hypothetical protein
LKIGYFELTKPNIETVNQQHWHDFFTAKEIKPDATNYIKNASRIIDFANLREEERKVVEALEKAEATLQDELAYSFYEGEKEGMTKARIATAQNALEMGLSLEQAAKLADLPLGYDNSLELFQAIIYLYPNSLRLHCSFAIAIKNSLLKMKDLSNSFPERSHLFP